MKQQRTRHHKLILVVGVTAVIALAGSLAYAQCCGRGGAKVASVAKPASLTPSPTAPAAGKCAMCKDGKMCKGCKTKSRQAAHAKLSERVSGALKDLSAAESAIQSGDKKTALAELAKVRKVLEGLKARVKPAAAGGIVNTVCPIMGGKVNPKLTVAYKDGKVGFCCGGCVPKWNKLSDTAKATKLAAGAKKK